MYQVLALDGSTFAVLEGVNQIKIKDNIVTIFLTGKADPYMIFSLDRFVLRSY